MARRDVEFNAEGVTLRGWFYAAGTGGAPAPAVVMAHGFSAELAARGIRKGDRVGLWGPNSAAWVAAFLGCAYRGVVVAKCLRWSPAWSMTGRSPFFATGFAR